MVDIDHFKAINDQYGHAAGDVIIKESARRLGSALRGVDSLGRYGGDEFIALLPQTGTAEAHRTAERLRYAIREHAFRAGGVELRATIRVGEASYPSDKIDSPERLIEEADRAMYRAKLSGVHRAV